MGKKFVKYFEDGNIKSCKKCGTHITKLKFILSKKYRGDYGTGFLTSFLINFSKTKEEKISMNSGDYNIYKINCFKCNSYIG